VVQITSCLILRIEFLGRQIEWCYYWSDQMQASFPHSLMDLDFSTAMQNKIDNSAASFTNEEMSTSKKETRIPKSKKYWSRFKLSDNFIYGQVSWEICRTWKILPTSIFSYAINSNPNPYLNLSPYSNPNLNPTLNPNPNFNPIPNIYLNPYCCVWDEFSTTPVLSGWSGDLS